MLGAGGALGVGAGVACVRGVPFLKVERGSLVVFGACATNKLPKSKAKTSVRIVFMTVRF